MRFAIWIIGIILAAYGVDRIAKGDFDVTWLSLAIVNRVIVGQEYSSGATVWASGVPSAENYI